VRFANQCSLLRRVRTVLDLIIKILGDGRSSSPYRRLSRMDSLENSSKSSTQHPICSLYILRHPCLSSQGLDTLSQ